MKKITLILFFFVSMPFAFAQQETGISGKVIDSKTQQPVASVVVTIQNTNLMQLTTVDGEFRFDNVSQGNQLVLFHSQGYKDALFPVEIIAGQLLDSDLILLEEDQTSEQQTSLITLYESDLSDDNSGSESTSGLLQSSKDAFQQAAAFNWGQARFRIRGLDSEHSTMMINGVSMNKLYDGRPQWGDWGGLNDALRNQEFSVGTAPSDYTFGGILGTQEINTRASIYRPGTRISFSGTNTNYSWRMMGTYASGMNTRGWALVVSAGKRWAQESYFEGTNYDANSGFISVEKKVNDNHSLSFTVFYTPNSRGKNSPNTTEVTQLTNGKYNSYWGFQDGNKRNSRMKTIEEPILMGNHFFKVNDKTTLNSSLMYQFGKIGNSNIDYQNANSPDPTYYRKLPSYYSSHYESDNGEFSGEFTPDLENAEKSKVLFLANQQIDWNAMYQANQNPIADINGTISGYEPSKSKYVLYEDRTDDKTIVATSTFNTQLTENVILNAGGSFKNLKSHNYQKLLDLLGGAFFEDIDAFYNGNQSQSDLNNPNRQVVVGDEYGYNYNYVANTLDAFTQFKFSYNKVDFYLAQSFSSTNYQREGLYKNGIYETNSFGKSKKATFENFGFKGGVTYKISGKQLLVFNAAHLTKAPTIRNTFPNSRLNNRIVDDLESENSSSLDASYIHRSPRFKARLTAFYTLIKDATQTSFFYAEGIFDDGAGYNNTSAFVSQTLTHLNKRNLGTELSLEYQINSTLKTTFSAAFGEYTYDSNPNVMVTNDAEASIENTNPVFDFGTAALKNYKQPGSPQQAYSLGIEYRDPKFWWIGVNINYLANSYIDFSPIARTDHFYINPASGFSFPEATEERAKELLQQEKFAPTTLLNLVGGKSWRIYGKYVGLFASVNNALNTVYKTGGYEQARNANFRKRNQDVSSGTPSFGNKYFYGYGRTYFVNISINL
ncbi:carboxypeptidase-like regulatory domain-containing protein [Flavobacterium gawalongense]|uniref:TonB-dependent receptor n=1 Tax=Flavobacterium gawalongense TaxID=2594432 RepID=A0A553BWA2_9FLAO|nr:carboxypeptidase-like regulatory domain-containing protein [Flavobacterium gawalongense]TRX02040.1 TonB-dependent receptor [Flavobacterium gawalongense]TRX12503.1 TonB-dependent receptor [Flavobacterium gawalongense]TRX12676.1 TonB-dependent receptor [Flavobacterium gawalongense]TRX30535.1 TonB-dependent receptor [Flavobacterium gawalongense]